MTKIISFPVQRTKAHKEAKEKQIMEEWDAQTRLDWFNNQAAAYQDKTMPEEEREWFFELAHRYATTKKMAEDYNTLSQAAIEEAFANAEAALNQAELHISRPARRQASPLGLKEEPNFVDHAPSVSWWEWAVVVACICVAVWMLAS